MAFIAQIKFGPRVDGKISDNTNIYVGLSDYKYHTVRHHNGLRPDGDKVCECIEVTLKVPDKSYLGLYKWYVSGESQSGCIITELSDSETSAGTCVCKVLDFDNAFCYAISEHYSVEVNRPREVTLSIMAESVTEREEVRGKTKTGGSISNGDSTNNSFKGMVVVDENLITKNVQRIDDNMVRYILRDFHYGSHRERDNIGMPYGPVISTCLDFSIRMESADMGRKFYDNMASNAPMDLTFLFDTSFNKEGKGGNYTPKTMLKDFRNVLVVRGYVVDVEESFDKEADVSGKYNLLSMRVKILMTDVTFAGPHPTKKEENFNWRITND